MLDDGSYAGDARLGDLPPGEERLVSYAVDLDMIVDVAGEDQEGHIRAARIADGVLEVVRKHVHRVVYTIENGSAHDKMVLVEHARRPGWELVDTPAPTSSTPGLHRFRVPVGAGETVPFTVQEEDVVEERIALLGRHLDQLAYLIRAKEIPGDVRRALERAVELQQAVARVEAQIQDRERRLAQITSEQNRIRENRKTVESGTDYYRRLLEKLEAQEDQIEQLQRQVAALREEREERQEALRRYLSGLNIR